MKANSKCLLITALMVIMFNLLPMISKAQLTFDVGDPDAPIDGGVSVLLIAGVGYGLKKANEVRKKKKVNADEFIARLY
jgi:hypothetical protein